MVISGGNYFLTGRDGNSGRIFFGKGLFPAGRIYLVEGVGGIVIAGRDGKTEWGLGEGCKLPGIRLF